MFRALLAEGRMKEAEALVSKLVARNAELERLLVEAKTKGHKSEGVSSAQLKLVLDGAPANTNASLAEVDQELRAASGIDEEKRRPAKKARVPHGRQRAPEHLRRVVNVLPVPAEERACPKCGAERRCIGHEVTEVIDLIPAEVIVRMDKREKLACEECRGQLVRAPLGDKVVAGGKMGTALVAQVLVEKYRDGLPLSRQVERFARLGLNLSISTLADQVAWAAEALEPLWRAAIHKVLRAKVMHLDATSLSVLDPEAPNGIKLAAIWGYVGSEVEDEGAEHTAVCLYTSTAKAHGQREGELGPSEMLAQREGLTVADASTLFDASFQRKGLVECGCNMHARRYFTRALDAGDTRAALPVAAFKRLYALETEHKLLPLDRRHRARQEQSRPVYDKLLAWAAAYQPHEPPSSALGKAIGYLLRHQLALRRYLQHPVVPLDNGVVERLHIRTALTRKNFLYAGSDAGAQRAAVVFTILGSCALAQVDPIRYLADVLPRLATRKVRLKDVAALLPTEWKRTRSELSLAAAN